MITYILRILRSSNFCRIWVLNVACVNFNHFYYGPCLNCWVLFHSLVPAICNRASYAQIHKWPWRHWRIVNNREDTMPVFLTAYIYIYIYIYYTYISYILYIYILYILYINIYYIFIIYSRDLEGKSWYIDIFPSILAITWFCTTYPFFLLWKSHYFERN